MPFTLLFPNDTPTENVILRERFFATEGPLPIELEILQSQRALLQDDKK